MSRIVKLLNGFSEFKGGRVCVEEHNVSKFNKYEKAGVKEYWIIEPDCKFVSVFTLQNNKCYRRPIVDQKPSYQTITSETAKQHIPGSMLIPVETISVTFHGGDEKSKALRAI